MMEMSGRHFRGFGFWLTTAGVLLLGFASTPVVTQTELQTHYYNLMNDMFNGYKKEVRPTNDAQSTIVDVAFWLLSIQNLDEKNQILSTSIILQTSWTDPWLTWDPANYGNISHFRYPQKSLWLPDISVLNTVKTQSQLGYDENPVVIDQEGRVQWFPSEIIQTACDIDVTYYPFDTQVCDVIISTWVSTSLQIDLNLAINETSIIKRRFSPSGTWELSSSSLQSLANDEDGATRLKYTFKLRRLSTFYVLNMILPVLLLSLTASAVFYLPSDAGEKIGMSMTILLSFAVYLTIISDNMPQTSLQISVLSVYLTILLGVTAMSVVLSVLILHWHHTPEDTKVGRRMTAVTRKLRTWMHFKPRLNGDDNDSYTDGFSHRQSTIGTLTNNDLSRLKNGKVSPADVSTGKVKIHVKSIEKEEKITWSVVSETFDMAFFYSISFFVLFVTFLFMLVLVIGGEVQNKKG